MTFQKQNGIFYTPIDIADYLANRVIDSPRQTVFDPCFGNGILLLSAFDRLEELKCIDPINYLYGLDLNPHLDSFNGELSSLCNNNQLKKGDFFKFSSFNNFSRFDVIMMNPPYVRHHRINKEYRDFLRKLPSINEKLPRTSDLWAYFVLHSLSFLKKGGNVGLILPWSILFADYARYCRKILTESFSFLSIHILNGKWFKDAQEKIVLLIGKSYGSPNEVFLFSIGSGVTKRTGVSKEVSNETWKDNPIELLIEGEGLRKYKELLQKLDFRPLSNYVKVSIGIVTGANDFFIIDSDKVQQMNIPSNFTRNILVTSKELSSLHLTKTNINNKLILILPQDSSEFSDKLRQYIKYGESRGIHRRYHPSKRPKWYSIGLDKPPAAFLHYMTSEVPYMVENNAQILSTNTIHWVKFNENLQKDSFHWIQLSMLSSISQLSIELASRSYGGGILKVEPGAISRIMVYPGNSRKIPRSIMAEVEHFLRLGNRRAATKFVDNWLLTELDLDIRDLQEVCGLYEYVRSIRYGHDNLK